MNRIVSDDDLRYMVWPFGVLLAAILAVVALAMVGGYVYTHWNMGMLLLLAGGVITAGVMLWGKYGKWPEIRRTKRQESVRRWLTVVPNGSSCMRDTLILFGFSAGLTGVVFIALSFFGALPNSTSQLAKLSLLAFGLVGVGKLRLHIPNSLRVWIRRPPRASAVVFFGLVLVLWPVFPDALKLAGCWLGWYYLTPFLGWFCRQAPEGD